MASRLVDLSHAIRHGMQTYPGLPGLVVAPARADRVATAADLPDVDLRGRAVLFHTGWSRHFGSERYFEDHPHLEAEVAEALVRRGAALVGIDSLNIDATRTGERPVHTALLAAGIPIVEHLTNLAALPAEGFRFFAVPVKVEGLGSFPVRAFAIVDEAAEEARAARRRAA
jgi:kynurenine formamidase